MGHNSKCLEDIEAALMFGYPEDMQYKLMDRRGRCLLRCQRLYEAQEALEVASLLVQKSKLSAEDKLKFKQDIKDSMNQSLQENLEDRDEEEKMESEPVPSVRSSLARPCSIPRPTTLSKTSTIKTLNSLNTQPPPSQTPPSQPKTENNNNVKSVSLLQPVCRKPTNLDLVNIRQVSCNPCEDFLHKTCVQSQTQPRHSPHSAAPGAGSLGLRQSVSDDSVGGQNPET